MSSFKEQAIKQYENLRSIILEKEFLAVLLGIKEESPDIGRPELEAYLFILRSHDTFGSLTDIYNVIYKSANPKKYLNQDKKLYFGENGILKRLQRAELILQGRTTGNKKKTWSKRTFVTSWKRVVMRNVYLPNAGSYQGDISLEFTEEQIILGLQSYLYDEKLHFPLTKQEVKELEEMSFEDLRIATNKMLSWLGIYTIEGNYDLFHGDEQQDKESRLARAELLLFRLAQEEEKNENSPKQ